MQPANFAFSNDRMFNRVMSDPSICARVLERILGVEVGRVEYHNTQQEMSSSEYARGIRMDVFLKSSEAVYDVEIQSRQEPSLPRRFRYYQSAIDSGLLERGQDYDLLPESWIIFICRDDPFGRGLPAYTAQRTCLEDPGLEIECGSHWLALNAGAWASEGDAGVRSLLRYVESGAVPDDDPLVRDIDRAVREANHDERWVSEMFSVSTVEENAERRVRILTRQALAQGIEEGKAEGKAEEAARYNQLVVKLSSEGRLEELAQAAQDPALLAALFDEL